MDLMSLLEKAWDKGSWCVVAVILALTISRVANWIKPWLESLFQSQIQLVNTLGSTNELQATANTHHAEANQQTAKAVEELKPILDELHRTVCRKVS